MEKYYRVIFNYKNVPKFIQKPMSKWFMDNRSEAIRVYNEHINDINEFWKSTGEPYSFGDFIEDINPRYVNCIRKKLAPHLKIINKRFKVFKFRIDDIGDIVGYIPLIKKSNLFITLEEIGSK